jgi:hypothetical protein
MTAGPFAVVDRHESIIKAADLRPAAPTSK